MALNFQIKNTQVLYNECDENHDVFNNILHIIRMFTRRFSSVLLQFYVNMQRRRMFRVIKYESTFHRRNHFPFVTK